MKLKYNIVLAFLLISLSLLAQVAQPEEKVEQTRRQANQRVLIEEEGFDAEVEIRLPEGAVLPRRQVEEIRYSLRFLHDQFIQSNRLLY